MRMKLAVTNLAIALVLSISGCNTRNDWDVSSIVQPRAPIPNAGPQSTDEARPAPRDVAVASPAVETAPGHLRTTAALANTSAAQTPVTPASAAPDSTASIRPRTAASISFTPVIGAPVSAVQPLSRRLGSEARTHGIVILNSNDGNSNHILKGYFSAFAEGDKTTVAFVWDVLDTQGNRLHRIRGQEIVQGTATDPWNVVEDTTMEAIAARTIEDYLYWRAQSS